MTFKPNSIKQLSMTVLLLFIIPGAMIANGKDTQRTVPIFKWGYIDTVGKFMIQPQFDLQPGDFSEGLASIDTSDGTGYIDKRGKVAIKPQFTTSWGKNFSEGRMAINRNGKWGFIDTHGAIVIEPQFDSVSFFKEGLAAVEVSGKNGYIDKSGRVAIEPQFDWAGYFSEGLAEVKLDNKVGYIDKRGNQVIKPQFDDSFGTFSEGLASVKKDEMWGYIDTSGNTVIQPQFTVAMTFHEDLAAVKKDSKYGYIDKTGQIVIKPQFEWAQEFSEGLARITQDRKIGFIDKTGQVVIPPRFDDASGFVQGLATVTENGREYFINKKGMPTMSHTYEEASLFHEGLAKVCVETGTLALPFGLVRENIPMKVPFASSLYSVSCKEGYKFLIVVSNLLYKEKKYGWSELVYKVADEQGTEYMPIAFGFAPKYSSDSFWIAGYSFEGETSIDAPDWTPFAMFFLVPQTSKVFSIKKTVEVLEKVNILEDYFTSGSHRITGLRIFGALSISTPVISKNGWGLRD